MPGHLGPERGEAFSFETDDGNVYIGDLANLAAVRTTAPKNTWSSSTSHPRRAR